MVGKPLGKQSFGRPGTRRKNDIRDTGCVDERWIHVTQYHIEWCDLLAMLNIAIMLLKLSKETSK